MILFDNADLEKELSPILEEIEIQSRYRNNLPEIHAVFKEINATVNRNIEKIPSLVSIPKVTVPLLERVFLVLADYYHAVPWEKIPYEFGIEINYPIDAPARYVVVIGVEGTVFGLAVYNNFEDFQSARKNVGTQESPPDYPFFAFTYENGTYISFDDLDAIERYGWEIPNENAYPSLAKYTPETKLQPQLPALDDLLWLIGVLPSITYFFENLFDIDEFFDGRTWNIAFNTKTLAGDKNVRFYCPVENE